MSDLKEYMLSFYISGDLENRMYWRCKAEDYDHAVEQLLNAEPDTIYYELVKEVDDENNA